MTTTEPSPIAIPEHWETEWHLHCWCCDWLELQGWTPYIEIPNLGVCHDIVAVKNDELMVVEVKLHNWKRVLKQVLNGDVIANYLVIALPRVPNRARERCREKRVGVVTPNMNKLPALEYHEPTCPFQRELVMERLTQRPIGHKFDWNQLCKQKQI